MSYEVLYITRLIQLSDGARASQEIWKMAMIEIRATEAVDKYITNLEFKSWNDAREFLGDHSELEELGYYACGNRIRWSGSLIEIPDVDEVA